MKLKDTELLPKKKNPPIDKPVTTTTSAMYLGYNKAIDECGEIDLGNRPSVVYKKVNGKYVELFIDGEEIEVLERLDLFGLFEFLQQYECRHIIDDRANCEGCGRAWEKAQAINKKFGTKK